MKVKHMLRYILTLISLSILIACDSGAQQENPATDNIDTAKQYRWKMVTTWPPGFPVLQEGAERFADNIKAMSNGRLDIKVYAGGELIHPYKLLTQFHKVLSRWAMAALIIGQEKYLKHNFSQPFLWHDCPWNERMAL